MTANNNWFILTTEYGTVEFELQYVTKEYRVLKSVRKLRGEHYTVKLKPYQWQDLLDAGMATKA